MPGYLDIDVKYLPQMADKDRQRCLFMTIDRASRRFLVRICFARAAATLAAS